MVLSEMKTIFLNNAIISYVQFVQKAAGGTLEKESVKSFLKYYRQYSNDKEFIWTVPLPSAEDDSLTKIYYGEITQVWAFVHFLVEFKAEKHFSIFFGSYTREKFSELKAALKKIWFYNPPHCDLEFIYLESEDFKIPVAEKRSNLLHKIESLEEKTDMALHRTKYMPRILDSKLSHAYKDINKSAKYDKKNEAQGGEA